MSEFFAFKLHRCDAQTMIRIKPSISDILNFHYPFPCQTITNKMIILSVLPSMKCTIKSPLLFLWQAEKSVCNRPTICCTLFNQPFAIFIPFSKSPFPHYFTANSFFLLLLLILLFILFLNWNFTFSSFPIIVYPKQDNVSFCTSYFIHRFMHSIPKNVSLCIISFFTLSRSIQTSKDEISAHQSLQLHQLHSAFSVNFRHHSFFQTFVHSY